MSLNRFFHGFFEIVQFTGGKYRPDIDGLRALAVLAVLVYHYFPGRLPGGFIGVDIFFVISGYLITGILERSFEKHSFGHVLWDFYQRRIRRIFPAVAIVLATLLVTGWLFLFPDEYKTLGAHVAAGAGFVENILLWSEAGYFDAEAIQKPLLHFWSLAVEEQFYIFWPFVLWLAIRRKWPLLDTIAAIIVISMALNIWAVWRGDTTGAFYLPMMRTWELMAGAWLAVAHRKEVLPQLPDWVASQLAWGGLLMIVVGLAALRPSDAFPGFWALLPVLGCTFILHAGRQSVLNRVFLSWRPAVWIGLVSYPLYLWHWALLSMADKLFEPGTRVVMRNRKAALIVLSIFLAWLVYRLIEKPIRARGKVGTTITLIIFVFVIGVSGFGVYWARGVNTRPLSFAPIEVVESYLTSIRYAPEKDECYNIYENEGWPDTWYCTIGDKEATEWIAVMGDSHAMSLIPAFDEYGKSHNLRVIFSSKGACPAFLNVTSDYKTADGCVPIAGKMIHKAISEGAIALVSVQRWSAYLGDLKGYRVVYDNPDVGVVLRGEKAVENGVSDIASKLGRASVPYIVLEDVPWQKEGVPVSTLRSMSLAKLRNQVEMEKELNKGARTKAEYERGQKTANVMLKNVKNNYSDAIHILSVADALCEIQVCPVAKNGEFLYYDKGHLSVAGAMIAFPALEKEMNSVLKK